MWRLNATRLSKLNLEVVAIFQGFTKILLGIDFAFLFMLFFFELP